VKRLLYDNAVGGVMHKWFVVYKDGSIIKNKPQVFSTAEIDLAKLDKFVLQEEGSEIPSIIVHYDDSRKRPIYVRRTEIPTSTRPYTVVCHIIGWQMTVAGENIQSVTYLFETIGRFNEKNQVQEVHWMEHAGKFDRERSSWFAPPSDRQINMFGSKSSD